MTTRRPLRGLLMVTAILLAFAPLATQAAHPVPGTWTVTGPMHEARAFQTATLLPSGLVLVAGGCQGQCSGTDPEVNLTSAELYHPHTGSWANTGSMHDPRIQYTATLLRDGRVLVAGGCRTSNCTIVLATAELYDPRTGTWAVTGSMHRARTGHTATLLADGHVLVAGGDARCGNGTCVPIYASAELYNPNTGAWSVTGSMHQPRTRHTATLLPDGQVLVAGSAPSGAAYAAGDPLASAELYDPRSGRWTRTGSMNSSRAAHAATLLPTGLVLVAGGVDAADHALVSAELYHPRTGAWTETGPLHQGRGYQTGQLATLLHTGQVLVAGNAQDGSGNQVPSAEVYRPSTGTWTVTGSMRESRGASTATLLPDGRVLVAGGASSNGLLTSAELYQP